MSHQSDLSLHPDLLEEMRAHVKRLLPEEACGLLSGRKGRATRVFSITNELRSPVRFRMDPREMLDAFLKMEQAEEELVGIYHSHPTGPASPSPTDLAEFAYPGTVYLIWSLSDHGEWQVLGFSLDAGTIREVQLAFAESNE